MKSRKLLGRVVAFAMAVSLMMADMSAVPAMAAEAGYEAVEVGELETASQTEEVTSSDDDEGKEEATIVTEEATESVDLTIEDETVTSEDTFVEEETTMEVNQGDELGIEVNIFDEYYTTSNGKWDFYLEAKSDGSLTESTSAYIWLTVGGVEYKSRSSMYINTDGRWAYQYCEGIPIDVSNLGKDIEISWALKDRSYNNTSTKTYASGAKTIKVVEKSVNESPYIYMASGESQYYVDNLNLGKDIIDALGSQLKLIIKDGTSFIAASEKVSFYAYGDHRYNDVKKYAYNYSNGSVYQASGSLRLSFGKYSKTGVYDIYVSNGDEEKKLTGIQLKVINSGEAIIETASVPYNYGYIDEADYSENDVYIEVTGTNIDADKLDIEITSKEDKSNKYLVYKKTIQELGRTGKTSAFFVFSRTDIFKNARTGQYTFDVAITPKVEGYVINDNRKYKDITITNDSTGIIDKYYDYKAGKLDVKLDRHSNSEFEYTIYLADKSDCNIDSATGKLQKYDNSIYEYVDCNIIASATGVKMNDNMLLSSALVDSEGNAFVPQYNGNYYVYVIYKIGDKYFVVRNYERLSKYYNYSSSSSSSGGSTVTATITLNEAYIIEGNKAETSIYSTVKGKISVVDGSAVEVVAGKDFTTLKSTTKITLDTEALTSGIYKITFTPDDNKIATRTAKLLVYKNNTFYEGTNAQSLSRMDNGNIDAYIQSTSTYLETQKKTSPLNNSTDNWKITVEDRFHNLLYSGKPVEVSLPTGTYGGMDIIIPVPAGEESDFYNEYAGLFVKIEKTYDNGNTYSIAKYDYKNDSVVTDKTYYSNYVNDSYYTASDEHGMWSYFNTPSKYGITFSEDTNNSDLNKHGYYAVYSRTANMKLAVYQYHTTNKLAEMNISSDNTGSNKAYYPYVLNITNSLLSAKGLSSKKVYTLKIIDDEGRCYRDSENGYLVEKSAPGSSNPVSATEITINPSELYMTVNSSPKKVNYTVKPVNATYTIKSIVSSNVEVAEIVDDTIVPKKVGDATVTITTNNGKSGTCKVHVGELKAVNGAQAPYELNAGSKLAFTVTDGAHAFPVDWSSTNTSVATVSSTGYVTAVGNGTATIKAKTSDGLINESVDITGVTRVKSISMYAKKNSVVLSEGDVSDNFVVKANPSVIDVSGYVQYSTESDVVSVEASTGKITPIKAGTAIIKATVAKEYALDQTKDLEATATILVLDDTKTIYAVKGYDKTLDDIKNQLPTGWNWMDGAMPLSELGTGVKKVRILNVEDATAEALVSVEVVSAEAVLGGYVEKVAIGDSVAMTPSITLLPEKNAALEAAGYTFTTSVSVVNKYKNLFEYEAGQLSAIKAGKAVISLVLTAKKGDVENKVFEKNYSVTAVDAAKKGAAAISYVLVTKNADGTVETPVLSVNGVYMVSASDTVYIKNTTEPYNVDKTKNTLKYVSGDTQVIKIGKTNGAYTPMTFGPSGCGVVRVTAEDAFNSNAVFNVEVGPAKNESGVAIYNDKNVVLDKYSVTLNPNMTAADGVCVVNALIPGNAKVVSVNAVDKRGVADNSFSVYNVNNAINIAYKPEAKTKNIYLKVVLNDANNSEVVISKPVAVTVKASVPKITVKQTGQLAVTRKGSTAPLTVNVPGNLIKAITADESAKYDVVFAGTPTKDTVTGIVKLKDTTAEADVAKKTVKLNVELAGYVNPIAVTFKVATSAPAVALSSTSGTVYIGKNNTLPVQFIDKATNEPMSLTGMAEDITVSSDKYITDVDIVTNTLYIKPSVELKNGKSEKIKIKVHTAAMQYAKELVYTVKYLNPSAAGLQLSSPKVVLYNYGEGQVGDIASTVLTVKGNGNTGYISKVVGPVAKSKPTTVAEYNKLALDVKQVNNSIVVSAAIMDTSIKAGDYTYAFTLPKSETGASKDATVNLKVTVTAATGKKAPKVSVTTKGKLDVLNRSTGLNVTPKFTNMAVKDAEVLATLKGRDAHLFELSSDGKTLKLLGDARYNSKNKYSLYIKYDIAKCNAVTGDKEFECSLNSPVFKIKVTQSKPKVKQYHNGQIFSMLRTEEKSIAVSLTDVSDSPVLIERVVANNSNNLAFLSSIDAGESSLKLINISCKPALGTIAKGKTYTLKYDVYPKGCCENEKPITVSYKVSIAN